MKPVIGRCAPMPRPTARRLSDINPYARLEAIEPARWDRIVGRVCGAGLVIVVALLALGIL